MQKVGESEYRQVNIQCDMIFMLGGLWAARFCLVGQIGLEPTMVKPADLQSAAIAARRLTHMAERAELESDTQRVRLA